MRASKNALVGAAFALCGALGCGLGARLATEEPKPALPPALSEAPRLSPDRAPAPTSAEPLALRAREPRFSKPEALAAPASSSEERAAQAWREAAERAPGCARPAALPPHWPGVDWSAPGCGKAQAMAIARAAAASLFRSLSAEEAEARLALLREAYAAPLSREDALELADLMKRAMEFIAPLRERRAERELASAKPFDPSEPLTLARADELTWRAAIEAQVKGDIADEDFERLSSELGVKARARAAAAVPATLASPSAEAPSPPGAARASPFGARPISKERP